jgi:hypothetical protein
MVVGLLLSAVKRVLAGVSQPPGQALRSALVWANEENFEPKFLHSRRLPYAPESRSSTKLDFDAAAHGRNAASIQACRDGAQ